MMQRAVNRGDAKHWWGFLFEDDQRNSESSRALLSVSDIIDPRPLFTPLAPVIINFAKDQNDQEKNDC